MLPLATSQETLSTWDRREQFPLKELVPQLWSPTYLCANDSLPRHHEDLLHGRTFAYTELGRYLCVWDMTDILAA